MTMAIEIHEATLTKNICTVFYSLQDEQGVADVNQTISTDKLIQYIEANELNLVEFINYAKRNLECDGLDEYRIPAYAYLEKNTFDVVKMYLEGELV